MSFYAGTHEESVQGPPSTFARPRPRLAALVAALLALLLGLGGLLLTRSQRSDGPAVRQRASSFHELGRLPLAQRAQFSTAAGAAGAGFAIRTIGPGRLAAHGRGLQSSFTASGAEIGSGETKLSFSAPVLAGDVSVAAAAPQAAGNRVNYQGSMLSEWYANGPSGLEQGFNIAAEPASGAELRIAFTVAGSAPKLGHGVISLGGGLTYGGLSATDADGRHLPASMQVQRNRIVLVVDASGAHYPVRVDPLVYQQKLETGEPVGSSVAISSDGNTALVGGESGYEPGEVDVFVRSGTVWTLQQRLSPGGSEGHEFGFARVHSGAGFAPADGVALSGEGNTAMINSANGVVWTYTRVAGVWTADKKTLQGFGSIAALSYNGETAALSSAGEGPVTVFERKGAGWKQTASIGDPTEDNFEDFWGYGLAISGNGQQLAIGAPGRSGSDDEPLIYFYGKEAGGWSVENTIEYPHYDQEAPAALALDREGDTAIIGEYLGEAYPEAGNNGAAWVYTRTGNIWSLQQGLVPEGEDSEAEEIGIKVGLSEDGSRAIVQAYGGNIGPLFEGAVDFEFTRGGSTWTQQGGALAVHGSFDGDSVLSGEGHTLLVAPGGGEAPEAFVNQPTVSAATASEVTTSTALLAASVNPAGETVISCEFQYGTTTAYGSEVPCSPKPAEQTSPVAVSASLKSLAPGTTYHFRVALIVNEDEARDSDGTFTTFKESNTATTKETTKPAKATVGPLTAVASGGTGSVTVGTYGSEPGTAPLPGSTGDYADLYESPNASFTEVEFKDCEIGDARALWFYTKEGWVPAEPAATFSEGCGHFTATATSHPSVSELVGLRSKWGEPPGEYGECEEGAQKAYTYAEKGCLKVEEKDGKATGTGKYEWYPVPVGCFPMKKGRYSEGDCTSIDESSKGKGLGSYEVGNTAFTGTTGAAKLTISGGAAIECTSGAVAGELTGPEKGTETLALGGCSQSGETCTSAQGLTGTIQTTPLEAISYEEGGKYLLALTGVDLAQFSCAGTNYLLTGAVSGPQGGVVNAMSKKGTVTFASGEGAQLLVLHSGSTEHAATLSMTQTDASNQSLELDSAITSNG